ncbi:MAG: dCTP deaminase [Candidatus Hydrothermarchaeales archaeon]
MGLKVLPGERVVEFLEDLIYEKTQLQEDGVDLTAKHIYIINIPGGLDFGGSELEISKRSKFRLEKRDPSDKYGWWNLPSGQYILEFNEKLNLPKGKVGILQPRSELIRNGAHHSTLVLSDGLPEVTLSVGSAGIKIKQNARVSRLMILDVE